MNDDHQMTDPVEEELRGMQPRQLSTEFVDTLGQRLKRSDVDDAHNFMHRKFRLWSPVAGLAAVLLLALTAWFAAPTDTPNLAELEPSTPGALEQGTPKSDQIALRELVDMDPVEIDDVSIENRATAAEPSGKGSSNEAGGPGHYFPNTASEYAKMVEPELGVPPKVVLDDCIEIPLYLDGVQKYGVLEPDEIDNPTRLAKETTASGSVMQRYEGRTADGKPLPHVVWIAFGRNENDNGNHRRFGGSVQMIGYHKTTGATAFFETNYQNLNQWVTQDETTLRMRGEIPWIDEPKEFNKAFVTPAAVNTQCVSCHQADPFITNPFVNAAKIPGTDENVVPILDADSPYYVIGGEDWDMRTIHIEDNACFDCHRVGMKTFELFTAAGWDANEYMPPDDPGSLAEDYRELLDAWQKGPEHVDGAEWIIPPARGKDRQVVGDDYPYKAAFNKPGIHPLD